MTGLTVERESSIKLRGVWIDENLTWGGGGGVHSHTFLKKIEKNVGLLY